MESGAFVAVEIQKRCRVLSTLFLQIMRLRRSGGNRRHEQVDRLQRIIHQQAPFSDYVVSAAGVTTQQPDQIESLTDDALVGIKAVIGNDNQHCFWAELALLNPGPNSADQAVDVAQRRQMRCAVIVVMSHWIERGGIEVQVTDSLILKTLD